MSDSHKEYDSPISHQNEEDIRKFAHHIVSSLFDAIDFISNHRYHCQQYFLFINRIVRQLDVDFIEKLGVDRLVDRVIETIDSLPVSEVSNVKIK